MTGTSWMILLSVLALSAAMSMTAMKKLNKPLPEYKKPEQKVVSNAATSSTSDNLTDGRTMSRAQENRNYDLLWEKSLFKDDRTEVVATEGGDAAAATETVQTNSDFELVGIACLGRKEAKTPVAIILQNRNVRNNRMANRPGMRRGGAPVPAPQQNAAPEEEERKADKSLFRVGDSIGKTGYQVKEINLDENKVILSRNGQDITLVLDEKNTNNSIRREKVKNEAMAVREKYKQEEKKAQETRPVPVQNNTQVTPNAPNPPNLPNTQNQANQPGNSVQTLRAGGPNSTPPMPPGMNNAQPNGGNVGGRLGNQPGGRQWNNRQWNNNNDNGNNTNRNQFWRNGRNSPIPQR